MFVEDGVGIGGAASSGELVPRQTIESIVRKKEHAIKCFALAWSDLNAASETLTKAAGAVHDLHPSETRMNHHVSGQKAEFIGHLKVPDRAEYMAQAAKIVNTEAWAYVIEITDLQRLMDKKAKADLFQQLLTNPPDATVENIQATLQEFVLTAGTIFRRGIANCFSALDRRFRSHDGFKIGRRIILDHFYTECGSVNYHRDMESTLLDIERTFFVLDDVKVPDTWSGIAGLLRENRSIGWGPRQGLVENEFFKVMVYKNGNCHVWFKRDDLVEKVNKLLAEYYGAVIPDGETPEDDGGLYNPKTLPAKNYGWFPTPEALAQKFMEDVPLLQSAKEPRLTILEPSAGNGALARLCFTHPVQPEGSNDWQIERAQRHNSEYRFDNAVDCVEINGERCSALMRSRVFRNVVQADFLSLKPSFLVEKLYDRVVMNPPFDRERDIDHVIHAIKFLKPDGYLCAIMSAGTEFRDNRKSVAFRALMRNMGARFSDLPAGSFSSVGTNVNTIMVYFWNNGRTIYGGRPFEA